MTLSRGARALLGVLTGLVLLVIYLPLGLVVVNAFNTSTTFTWPPDGFTTKWWGRAWESQGAREALMLSLQVAALATVISLVLGTMAALALQRHRFFGRDAISLLIIHDRLLELRDLAPPAVWIAPASLWVALAVSMYSGGDYFVRFGRLILYPSDSKP